MAWIGAAAAIGGALINSMATSGAASDQADATNNATGEQRRQFDLTRGDFAPYRETGVNALRQLAGDVSGNPTAAEVMAQPGYQFGLDQGQNAIDRKIAAMGGRVSGAAIKQAGRFGTNYATTTYNAEYQRRQDRLNRLATLANIGQVATGASAQAGAGAANAIGGYMQSQGDASGASRIAQANIWGNTGNQLAAMYGRNQSNNGFTVNSGNWSGYSDPNANIGGAP